jgi:hypothetical protein
LHLVAKLGGACGDLLGGLLGFRLGRLELIKLGA